MEAQRTTTETETEAETPLQMHLQPARPAVRWAEDVIDNEEMNKKKSNSDPSTGSLLHLRRTQEA
jgi:hypothetical protein